MKEGLHFYYDGKYSVDYGLINCKIDSGMYEDVFLAEREIIEIDIRGRETPYFQEVRRLPLTFSLTFAFVDRYDEKRIREVARWLSQDTYKPFYTDVRPEIIFYCMPTSSSQLLHNGLREGYVNIEMRCDSPYAYSPQTVSRNYDWYATEEQFSDNFNGERINLIKQSNTLILDPNKTKWHQINPLIKWADL